jgi:hypothetical protein
MSSNFEWQNFQTREQISDRLREAESHRFAQSGLEKRRFSLRFMKVPAVLLEANAKVVDFFRNGIKILQKFDVKV